MLQAAEMFKQTSKDAFDATEASARANALALSQLRRSSASNAFPRMQLPKLPPAPSPDFLTAVDQPRRGPPPSADDLGAPL